MSQHPRAVLLPKLFPLDLLTLGEFLTNPLQPTVNSHVAKDIALDPTAILSARPEAPYKTFVSLEKEGRFSVTFTKLLGLNVGAKRGNFLKIEAEEMLYRTLKHPEAIFRSICESDEASKQWIANMALYRKDFYFVVGLQELKNARFQRVVLREGDGSGHITLPLEHTGQLPIEAGVKVSGKGFGMADVIVNGIFGIEVRRVKCKVGKVGDPVVTEQISWVFAHEKTKGSREEERERVYVELGDSIDLEELERLCGLYEAEEADEDDED